MQGRTLHGAGKAKAGTRPGPVPGAAGAAPVDGTSQEALKRTVLYSVGSTESLSFAEAKVVGHVKASSAESACGTRIIPLFFQSRAVVAPEGA